MGMRINYNGAAANAWRNLGVSQDKLNGSVEKLSSGLRINKGADDPAGLIISERLKSQISGLGQAIKNAQEATSLVQTGEGALTEMNNMLNKMRGLAVHSANAGVNDSDTIAADQRQVDSALDSLQKIAQNTKYQSKILLDGSTNNTATYDSSASAYGNSLTGIDVNGSATGVTGAATLTVSTVSQRARISGSGYTARTNSASAFTISIASSDASTLTIGIASGSSATQVANQVNNYYAQTGVWASTGAVSANAGYSSQLNFTNSSYGSAHNVTVSSSRTDVIGYTSVFDAGQDAAGTLAYSVSGATTTATLTGSGLDLSVSSTNAQLAGTKISLLGFNSGVTAERASAALGVDAVNHGNLLTTVTDLFSVTAGALQFSLGQDANSTEIRTLTLDNMQVTAIGKGVTGLGSNISLNDIRSGSGYELSKDAANAVKIIDKAIDNVSITRATLGAFQQNALETTINTLSINKENLEASNSRIADVDMAQEMMQFTKNQILTQAGTAMLAQANQLPRSVMQLLQG